jgi:hypothetical protein
MRLLTVTLLCIPCLLGSLATVTSAAVFQFTNITDLAGGPGQGAAPSINNAGDIAFYDGTTLYIYDRSAGTFLNLMSLAGAPADAWFPRINASGNVVMIQPSTRDIWLFEAATQVFTNLATLAGYPGDTGANDLNPVFDINDNNKISFHSGDLNLGDVYVYDHTAGTFENINDRPGGTTRARENRINNFDQVAYNGFPDTYIYDPSTGGTQNITDLPGGPGSSFGSFSLNDVGDIAVYRSDEITYYNAATGSFLYFSTLPGFPPGNASVTRNGISDRGGMSFWRDEIFYFDPADSSFTQLTNQGTVPFPGLESAINDSEEIAFVAGGDVYLAEPPTPAAIPAEPSRSLGLRQNVPNPFNPSTRIAYDVPAGGAWVRLDVYDVAGRRVRTLVSARQSPGTKQVEWDGRNDGGAAVSSGVYFYRLRANGLVETQRMVLTK